MCARFRMELIEYLGERGKISWAYVEYRYYCIDRRMLDDRRKIGWREHGAKKRCVP